MIVLYQGCFFVVDSVCTTCLFQPVFYHLRTIQYFTYLYVVEDQHQEIRPGCIGYTHLIRQSNGLYWTIQVDAAVVYVALYNAALCKSGLVSNGCSGREIFLVYAILR